MTPVAFLLVALLLSLLGSTVLWWRSRKPTSLSSGIDSFRREMQALSPPREPDERDGRRR